MQIYVCKSCGMGTREAIASCLGESVKVAKVDCQKVCNGPVVGLPIDGTWQWFARMDSRKALAGISVAARTGKLNKALKKRRSHKREGKRR